MQALEVPLRHMIWSSRDGTAPGDNPENRHISQARKVYRAGQSAMSTAGGTKRLPSEKSSSSDSEEIGKCAEEQVSSSEDTSDNEDAETGHWKSKNKYREDEDEDMSRLWCRQKVDAFTRCISDFSEDKKRRMPANVKTYDGTGDPDKPHLISRIGGLYWVKLATNRVVPTCQFHVSRKRAVLDEVCKTRRVAWVETAPGFMNGINNPDLYQRLNDRVPQTFDDLMNEQSHGSGKLSKKSVKNFRMEVASLFPTLTADNAVVEPLTIEINAAGHDIHRMYIDGGASAAYYTTLLQRCA
ncbi:hypothetical protein Tco_1044526 [Tanacetum coccineum]|uniref:Uncharacterized protein n=1 Tax=Tanacetum coccineum TaxID=301880 RepID=A0ABQ5GRE6_9ASTR